MTEGISALPRHLYTTYKKKVSRSLRTMTRITKATTGTQARHNYKKEIETSKEKTFKINAKIEYVGLTVDL